MQIIKDYIEKGEQIIICCNSRQDAMELYEYLKSTFDISCNNLELVKLHAGEAFRIQRIQKLGYGDSRHRIQASYSEKEWYKEQDEFKHIHMTDWCPDVNVDIDSFETMIMED